MNLNIQGSTVTEFECDCPYDMGSVCKHVVAALFYLKKTLLARWNYLPKQRKISRKRNQWPDKRKNASFERIADAEQYIADSYPNELATLYRKLILTYLERNMGWEHYQTACRYIRRMIKLGARPMATDLVRELTVLYPARRALLEELGKV